MKRPSTRPRTRVGVRTLAACFGTLVACGGQSIRHIDDGSGGEPDEPPVVRGGSPSGGRGGAGAVGPLGGTGAFTGGSFTGGVSNGGSVPLGGTGGSIPTGGTGTAGTGGTAGTNECATNDPVGRPPPLQFGNDGIVRPGSNPYGISGAWYSFDDCSSATPAGLPCTQREPAWVGPDGLLGWFAFASEICVSGTAPRVERGPDGAPAYGLQWGFGVGISLNQGAPWNADRACVHGFVVDLSGQAPATIRINVVTPKTIGVSHFVEVPPAGTGTVVDFSTVRQGPWVAGPTPLDTTQITDLQFHVYTNEQAPVPYQFCVSGIRPW